MKRTTNILMLRSQLLGIIFCLIPLFSFAQQVTISGYVLDREDKPIEFANVKVKGKLFGATSNLKGFYSFKIPTTQDSVQIEYSSVGYHGVTRSLPGVSKDMRINVRLGESDIELEGVTIQAAKKQLNTMERINAEQIRVNAGPSRSVEAIVSTYAGVTQNNELSSQYSVRGGSYDENMVYVNGIEVYRPLLIRSAQQEGLSFINPDLTQSVLFSAGGFNANYGDKMSSVLDIRYKQPSDSEGSVTLGLMGSNIYYGSSIGKFSQVTGVRYKSGSSLLNTTDTDAEYSPVYIDGQTYMHYRISPKWSIGFLGNISLTRYKFIPHSRETTFGTITDAKKFKIYFDGLERDRFLTYFGAASLDFVPNENLRHNLTISAFNSNESETYDIIGEYFLNDVVMGQDGSASSSTDENSQAGLGIGRNHEHARNRLAYQVLNTQYSGELRIGEVHRLQVGLSLLNEKIKDHISEWEMRDSVGYSIPHTGTGPVMYNNLYSDSELKSTRISAYLQDRMRFETGSGTFAITPGIRASWWKYNKEIIVSPRLTIGYSPKKNEKFVFRAATGLYYQAPFYKELRMVKKNAQGDNVVVLNENIKSQGSAHFLLGGDYNFEMAERKFKFTAEAYFKYLFNINPYIVDNVKIRYLGENIGKGYALGIDLKIFGEFVPGVDSWLTASLMKAKQSLPGIGDLPLMNAPLYNVSLFFQDYFPGNKRIKLSLKAALSGGLPQMNPSKGFSMPAFTSTPYRRVDMGLTYQLHDRSEKNSKSLRWLSAFKSAYIGADIFNLFNISNVNSYYWISDAHQQQYAVPNYLTKRQWSLRLLMDF